MKRSLHIGINNYPGTEYDLAGCINDANDWQETLAQKGFKTSEILDSQATKSNMIEYISKLVHDTTDKDIAVITYSGHGTWVPDTDNDENDGRDEALCPYDINKGNIFKDDELAEIFSLKNKGARIIFISDSCHSGTVNRACNLNFGKDNAAEFNLPKIRYLAPEIYLKNDKQKLKEIKQLEFVSMKRKINSATILLAGCKDNEYSYDATFDQRPNGAFTYVAIQALKDLSPLSTYREWYQKIRKILPHVNYPQTPQLSGVGKQLSEWKVFAE